MKILVAGQPKTGTTILFLLLKQALPAHYHALYEPKLAEYEATHTSTNLLAKILLYPSWFDHVDPASFDKIVLIVRDPRDTIISALLWWVTLDRHYPARSNIEQFIATLEQKERAPRSLSVLDLITTLEQLTNQSFLKPFLAQLNISLAFHNAHPSCHVIHYHDIVDRHLDALTKYLDTHNRALKTTGIPLPQKMIESILRDRQLNWALITAGPTKRHRPSKLHWRNNHASSVDAADWFARTKTYNTWRHWFRSDDVAFFRPLFEPYLTRYQLSSSWGLARRPRIPAAHGSAFVRRLADAPRHNAALARLRTNTQNAQGQPQKPH